MDIENTIFICVFRHPLQTVCSIIRECESADYLKNIKMDDKTALNIWSLMYQHVLDLHCRGGTWLFVRYDQAFQPSVCAKIESMTGATVNRNFPTKTLQRSKEAPVSLPPKIQELYKSLCIRAGSEP